MPSSEQKKKLLKAKIAVALQDELVAGAKLGMRPEYCGGQLAKPVDAHTRPGCHNEGKL
jgi:hypothetical protein